jgi:protein-disulfide isomerase
MFITIIGLASFFICVIAAIGAMLRIFILTGLIKDWIHTASLIYFIGQINLWHIPLELFVAIFALILFAIRRYRWSVIWAITLLGYYFGLFIRNHSNPVLWITLALSIIALTASCISIEERVIDFIKELKNEIFDLCSNKARIWPAISVISMFIIIIVLVHNEIMDKMSLESINERAVAWYEAAKKGKTKEGIVLEIFSDYQCPACRFMVPQYVASARSVGADIVQIRFKDYPLDSACNNHIPKGAIAPHHAACSAAIAVRLINKIRPEESDSFKEWLYDNQSHLSDKTIRQKLKEDGILEFRDALHSELLESLQNDINDATKYGVNSTPSLVLNNVLLPSGINSFSLEAILRHEKSIK